MSASTLLYFIAASCILIIAPGPDNIFVMTQGITRGRKPAIVTALGMCSGIPIHTTAAALGISAVFYSSVTAFNILKYAGAVYLLYLAFKTVRGGAAIRVVPTEERPPAAMFRQGLLMNLLNPKVAMFFVAFLPQFAHPGSDYFDIQMLMLGFTFMALSMIIFSLIGYFSGSIGNYILSRPKIAKYLERVTAGVLASLGIRLAMMER